MHEFDFNGLDLNLLRVLHVLLEERNVTRAAGRLQLSQSATSHALARLRRHFGDPLLSRTAHGMQATSRAEALQPALARILADIAALAGAPPWTPARARGRVRLAVLPTVAMTLIPKLVPYLGEHAPALALDCLQWTGSTLDALETGGIDIAVGPLGVGERAGLRLEPLMSDRYVCVLRREHPAIARGLNRAAYEAWPHLLVDSANLQGGPVNQVLEALGVERPSTLTTHHALTAHLVVERTDLILTVTRTIGELYVRSADVVMLEPPVEVGELVLYLAWHARNDGDPLHRWLRGLLHQLAAVNTDLPGAT